MFWKKYSDNFWVMTLNSEPEIASLCSTHYICNKILIRKSLIGISHIPLFSFLFNVFLKIKYKYNWSFSLNDTMKVYFCYYHTLL